jgi:hypothetical protein
MEVHYGRCSVEAPEVGFTVLKGCLSFRSEACLAADGETSE